VAKPNSKPTRALTPRKMPRRKASDRGGAGLAAGLATAAFARQVFEAERDAEVRQAEHDRAAGPERRILETFVPGDRPASVAMENLGSFVEFVLTDAKKTAPALVDDTVKLILLLVAAVRSVTAAERLAPGVGWTAERLRNESHSRVLAAYRAAFRRSSQATRVSAVLTLLDRVTPRCELVKLAFDVSAELGDSTPVALVRADEVGVREIAKVWSSRKTDPRTKSKYARLAAMLLKVGIRVAAKTLENRARARNRN
jgi:hypothetical protein